MSINFIEIRTIDNAHCKDTKEENYNVHDFCQLLLQPNIEQQSIRCKPYRRNYLSLSPSVNCFCKIIEWHITLCSFNGQAE